MATRWRVEVRDPRSERRECSFFLVRYPPPGLVDEEGRPFKKRERSAGKGTSRQEAERLAHELESKLNATLPQPGGLTVRAAVEAYTSGKALSRSYLTSVRSAIKATAGGLAERTGAQLSRATLLRAQDALRKSGRRPGTINMYLNALATAWRWCYERELVDVPWPPLRRLRAKTRKRPFTPEEVQQVLAWLASYRRGLTCWHSFFTLLADTGARAGEIAELKGRDIDPARGRVRLMRRKSGGDEAEREELWVSASPEALALLPERQAQEWLWPARGKQYRGAVNVNSARLALRKALKALLIEHEGRLDLHSFRRYWITDADAAGVPLGVAMRQTGHSKPDIHLKYRRNAPSDDLADAVAKVRARRVQSETSPPQQAANPLGSDTNPLPTQPLRSAAGRLTRPGGTSALRIRIQGAERGRL